MVIQGAHDRRVVKYESDQIVEKLCNQGKKVEYLVFEDEGHGFTKYSNMIKAYKAAGEFLVKNLT